MGGLRREHYVALWIRVPIPAPGSRLLLLLPARDSGRDEAIHRSVAAEAPVEDPADWTHLACRITQGDREAEDDLARWFHPRVRVIALARLHGSDLALDIAQDTIVAVLDALRAGRVREPARLPAFVLGIANNLINNHHRTQARRREVTADPPPEPAGAETNVTHLDDTRRRVLVREALTQLNGIDRRILVLSFADGLHPRQIAPLVGLSPEVVRTRKSRAVRAMTEALKRRDTKPRAQPHTLKAEAQ